MRIFPRTPKTFTQLSTGHFPRSHVAIKKDPRKVNLIGEKSKLNLTKFVNFPKL